MKKYCQIAAVIPLQINNPLSSQLDGALASMIPYKGDSVPLLYNLLYLWQEREAALSLSRVHANAFPADFCTFQLALGITMTGIMK